MVNTYRLIYAAAKEQGVRVFDLYFVLHVLTENFQASSRGAIGATARERSADPDPSRHPLYNQAKAYSEVFRMLGWLRPGARRLEFSTTILGDLVAEDFEDRPDLIYGLFRQCLLAVTFPNQTTENIGVANHRPFRWLLLLAAELDGVITRHEMILGMLTVVDDLRPEAFPDAVDRVRSVRGGSRRVLDAAALQCAAQMGVQVTTLENYTRLPVGVLKSPHLAWGTSARTLGIYERPIEALTLSALGLADAEWLRTARDIRDQQLHAFSDDERAWFANYAYYAMLLRAGVAPSKIEVDLERTASGAAPILEALDLADPHSFVYSPLLEAPDAILTRSSVIE